VIYTSTRDVVIGVIAVVVGLVAAAAAVHAAGRTRNWLFLVCAVGSAVFVLGVVGQRVFPSEDTRKLEPLQASRTTPGPWDAGVNIPVINIGATPVAVGGLLLAVVGLSLVLFFEAVPEEEPAPPRPLPPLEDGETV
jgi:hypothetical protein